MEEQVHCNKGIELIRAQSPCIISLAKHQSVNSATNPADKANDLADDRPEVVARMKAALTAWQISVEQSLAGRDY
jgi:hypothetical protein